MCVYNPPHFISLSACESAHLASVLGWPPHIAALFFGADALLEWNYRSGHSPVTGLGLPWPEPASSLVPEKSPGLSRRVRTECIWHGGHTHTLRAEKENEAPPATGCDLL